MSRKWRPFCLGFTRWGQIAHVCVTDPRKNINQIWIKAHKKIQQNAFENVFCKSLDISISAPMERYELDQREAGIRYKNLQPEVPEHNSGLPSGLILGQWETSLQSNAVSHWLGTSLESALYHVLWGYPERVSLFLCAWGYTGIRSKIA